MLAGFYLQVMGLFGVRAGNSLRKVIMSNVVALDRRGGGGCHVSILINSNVSLSNKELFI